MTADPEDSFNACEYLLDRRVQAGEELAITAHGRVIARLVPDHDPRAAAKSRLAALRAKATVGDVVSPLADDWEATRDRP